MNVEKTLSFKAPRIDAEASNSNACWDFIASETQDRRQWTLKGIPPSAVDQTREAAKRSGMKLNAWVTQALYRAVEDAQMDDNDSESSISSDKDRIENLENYIKDSLVDLRRRTEEIENSMKSINAFLVRMYTER